MAPPKLAVNILIGVIVCGFVAIISLVQLRGHGRRGMLGFAPGTCVPGFDASLALCAAVAAFGTYEKEDENRVKVFESLNLTNVKTIFEEESEVLAVVAATARGTGPAVVVAFRGTATDKNINEDLNSREKPFDEMFPGSGRGCGAHARVHFGWSHALGTMKDVLADAIKDAAKDLHGTPRLLITGHSMGAATANLAAAALVMKRDGWDAGQVSGVDVIAVAPPRTGNHYWRDCYASLGLEEHSWQLAYAKDPVPQYPAYNSNEAGGYVSLGQILQLGPENGTAELLPSPLFAKQKPGGNFKYHSRKYYEPALASLHCGSNGNLGEPLSTPPAQCRWSASVGVLG
mmetsp:Transcript_4249/g.11994  ORF Transcript_4249/g.11994 Transcript_4249/m.11994 type:complete len:345 (-) Transcript_4249:109-1143(-)